MRIGLNMLFIAPGSTGGIETYAKGLLKGLSEIETRDEFIVFIPRKAMPLFRGYDSKIEFVEVDIRLENRLFKNCYEQFAFPFLIKTHCLDVLHSLAYVGPLACRVPQVVTIHDLNFLFPQHQLRGFKRYVLRWLCRASAARSRKIIAVSEFTRKEIAEAWPGLAKKCVTVHEGGDHVQRRQDNANGKRFGFLLFVGGGRHKNCEVVIKAFGGLKSLENWTLTLIGRLPADLRGEIMMLEDSRRQLIHEAGFLARTDLEAFLANSGCLIYPSKFEGFGLPVLEAQVSGLPVICANAASLPEIAGQGALLFSPKDCTELIGLMTKVEASVRLRDRMVKDGYLNSTRFSWAKAAQQMIDIYYEVALAGGKPSLGS